MSQIDAFLKSYYSPEWQTTISLWETAAFASHFLPCHFPTFFFWLPDVWQPVQCSNSKKASKHLLNPDSVYAQVFSVADVHCDAFPSQKLCNSRLVCSENHGLQCENFSACVLIRSFVNQLLVCNVQKTNKLTHTHRDPVYLKYICFHVCPWNFRCWSEAWEYLCASEIDWWFLFFLIWKSH